MLRRFILCGGVHGSRKALAWLSRLVDERRPDGVLFAGGIVGPNSAIDEDSSWPIAQAGRRFIEEFFAALGKMGVFTAVIPCLTGEPTEEFLRLALPAELTHHNVHVVHATLVCEDSLAVIGLGWLLAETKLLGVESCSRTTAEYFLRPLWTAKPSHKALLLPAPPPGKLGGREGKRLVSELVDSLHPDLCVVGGSTARRGSEHAGRTLVVNPGCLADGSAAWLDWSARGPRKVEFLDEAELCGRPAKDEIHLGTLMR